MLTQPPSLCRTSFINTQLHLMHNFVLIDVRMTATLPIALLPGMCARFQWFIFYGKMHSIEEREREKLGHKSRVFCWICFSSVLTLSETKPLMILFVQKLEKLLKLWFANRGILIDEKMTTWCAWRILMMEK